jgi:hypothetical protein
MLLKAMILASCFLLPVFSMPIVDAVILPFKKEKGHGI